VSVGKSARVKHAIVLPGAVFERTHTPLSVSVSVFLPLFLSLVIAHSYCGNQDGKPVFELVDDTTLVLTPTHAVTSLLKVHFSSLSLSLSISLSQSLSQSLSLSLSWLLLCLLTAACCAGKALKETAKQTGAAVDTIVMAVPPDLSPAARQDLESVPHQQARRHTV
jgi:hypothetical protein